MHRTPALPTSSNLIKAIVGSPNQFDRRRVVLQIISFHIQMQDEVPRA